jgi:hypothetical protein
MEEERKSGKLQGLTWWKDGGGAITLTMTV